MGGDSRLDMNAKPQSLQEIFRGAANKALAGGLTGAAAMGIQVGSLMWLRTMMNYQYRYGGTAMGALRTLYKEGGVLRFYRGMSFALIQGPLSRFGDTAANSGALALLNSYESTRTLPIPIKTSGASVLAGVFRIALMPVDACKTILQVEGKDGLKKLFQKVRVSGPTVFFHGALGAASATAVGHYPWFVTFNYLDEHLPWKRGTFTQKVLRNATNGLVSSVVSDVVSNSLRVLKTYRQTSVTTISYAAAARDIVSKEGITGLLFRGLGTRIVAHGINGVVFTVAWKILEEEYWKKKDDGAAAAAKH